jgi:hypothetical protein
MGYVEAIYLYRTVVGMYRRSTRGGPLEGGLADATTTTTTES